MFSVCASPPPPPVIEYVPVHSKSLCDFIARALRGANNMHPLT